MKEFYRYLKEKGYAKASIKSYESALKHFKGLDINRTTIDWYQTHIQQFKAATRFAYLCRLKRYLKHAYPELERYVILPKTPHCLPKDIPSQTEVRQIMQKPNPVTFKGIRDRGVLEFFYSSGIRKKELINLKLEDVDHSKRLIRINQGKNRKDRIVPISKKAYNWLKRYLEKVRQSLNPVSNHLFVSMYGKKMCPMTPYLIIKKYGEYSTHKYRHAYATHLLQNGMKETSLQRLLGHSQITSTQIYTKVTIKDLQNSYKKYHPRDKWKCSN